MSDKNHPEPHVVPLSVYLAVGLSLLVLTAVTVAVASVNLGPFNLVVAITIASIKASLVALFFMHLFYDNKLFMTVFLSAIMFLAVFIILTMFDTERRDDLYEETARPIKPEAVMYERLKSASPAVPAPAQPPQGQHD